MLPKKGIVFPNGENLGAYSRAVAYALKYELGSTHQAVKIVMGWTGAGERTVKNWLAGISGPSGQHIVELIRRSTVSASLFLASTSACMAIASSRPANINKTASTLSECRISSPMC
jgi:hypothetical protein